MNQMMQTISLLEFDRSKTQLNKNLLRRIKQLNRLFFKNDGETGFFSLISDDRIKSSHYVGVVQLGSQTIEVMPKIFGGSNNESFIKKNLLYMLSYVNKLDIKETNIANLKKVDDLFEVIIYLFAKNLLDLLKKDIVRNYVSIETNESFLRGKLLIKEQIKYNFIDKNKFFCSYDDLVEDTLLNQIFKATINKLLKFTKSNKNKKLLFACNFILQDTSLRTITLNDCNKIRFNRLNKVYENNFNLAKVLLFGNSTELNSSNTNSYSLLFDMNKLFEEFIGEFIKRNFRDVINEIKTPKASQYVFENTPKNFSDFILKPDIFIEFKNNKKLIIDTKYKELKFDKSNFGVSQSDIYQMMMYGLRYFEKEINRNNKKEIILLYPEYSNSIFEDNIDLISKENIRIKIRTINLHKDLTITKNREELRCEVERIIYNENKK